MKGLEKELNLKDAKLENLKTDKYTLQLKLDQLTDQCEQIQEKAATELKLSEEKLSNLENKLSSFEDYSEIKQELEALRMIEFGTNSNTGMIVFYLYLRTSKSFWGIGKEHFY